LAPSGDRLQPVTKAVVEAWERREAERAEAERQRQAALEKARVEAEAAAKRQQEEARLAHMRALVPVGASADLAIVPSRPGNALDRLAAERLPGLLARAAPGTVRVVPAMFADGVVNGGLLRDRLRG
jgi:hypothetical protein